MQETNVTRGSSVKIGGKGSCPPEIALGSSGVDWISGVSRTGATDDGLIRMDFNFFHSWFRVFCVLVRLCIIASFRGFESERIRFIFLTCRFFAGFEFYA